MQSIVGLHTVHCAENCGGQSPVKLSVKLARRREKGDIITPIESIQQFYGEGVQSSDWLEVEQSMINQFGQSTYDSDWLHTDPERAKNESPYGGTIAFGFWTVSTMTYFGRQILKRPYPGDALYGLNYGFDRLRLISPVRIGRKIRAHMQLMNIEDRGENQFLVKTNFRMEVDDSDKPAMMAEWLFLLVFPPAAD